MMPTPEATQRVERRSGLDRRQTSDVGPSVGWWTEPVAMTRRFLLFLTAVAFCFVSFATWAAVSTVNALRTEDCEAANRRRGEIQQTAHQLVDLDRQTWLRIEVERGEGPLPDPFRRELFDSFDQLDAQIDNAYAPENCP